MEKNTEKNSRKKQVCGICEPAALKKDFEPEYGARPLRRAVEHWIEDPLAEEILKGTFAGASGAVVELDKQKIVIVPDHKDE